MSNLAPFIFEGAAVRVVTREGEPWFVLADVCKVLEVGNVADAARRLDADEKGVDTIDTLGGHQEMVVINESGLYSLVLTSRKPAAKRFKKWVTAEVLPAIRKTGAYGDRDPMRVLNDPAAMRGLLLTYTEKVLALEARVVTLEPKADALDRLAASDGSLCITDAAKTLQVAPKALFAFLRARGWIYNRPGGATEIAYQDRITSGVLEHKTATITKSDGSEKTVTQVRVTPKGLAALALLLRKDAGRGTAQPVSSDQSGGLNGAGHPLAAVR